MWQRILAAGGILITASTASSASELRDCAAVAEPTARLACYDRLNPPQSEPATAAPAATITAPVASAPPAIVEAERFGAETLPPKAGDPEVPDAIESHISGSFTGWKKDTEFKLDNGQVWRCIDCSETYYRAENPAVTVKRNFVGSYWLKVEGLNTQARVRRIK